MIRGMDMLATLDNYQDQLWAIAREAERHLQAGDPQAAAEIDRLRLEFGQVMGAYQRFVHREVFELMTRTGTPAQVDRARAMKTECILIGEEFRAFVTSWPATDISARWPDYRAAGLEFSDRTRAHIEQVRGLVPA